MVGKTEEGDASQLADDSMEMEQEESGGEDVQLSEASFKNKDGNTRASALSVQVIKKSNSYRNAFQGFDESKVYKYHTVVKGETLL